MTKLAARFDVSGSYLARVCSELSVPRPERGYWAKLAVGKAPSPPPLPEAQPGDPLHWPWDGEHTPAPKPPRPPRPPQPRPARQVRIPKDRIHGLVMGAKAHFENSRSIDEGLYLKPFKQLLVDVTASKACLEKALELANDLFNAFEAAEHRVTLAQPKSRLRRDTIDERLKATKPRDHYHRGPWSPNRPTVACIGEVAIGLAIVEVSENILLRYVGGKYVREADYLPAKASRHYVDRTWTTTQELPSGRLRIVAYSPYYSATWSTEWTETGRAALQASLRTIVKAAEDAAPKLIVKLEEAERRAEAARLEQLAAHERWHRQEDQRLIEKSEKDSREQLAQVIQHWSDTVSVERFLSAVEARAAQASETERDGLLERVRLARAFLGTQDPLDFIRSWRTPSELYRPEILKAAIGRDQ